MAIAALILGILGIVIAMLSFIVSLIIAGGLINGTTNKQNPSSTNDAHENIDAYQKGKAEMLDMLQLAMYDLFRCGEILDFNLQTNELTDRMLKLSQDEPYRNNVTDDLLKYIKELKNDDNLDSY